MSFGRGGYYNTWHVGNSKHLYWFHWWNCIQSSVMWISFPLVIFFQKAFLNVYFSCVEVYNMYLSRVNEYVKLGFIHISKCISSSRCSSLRKSRTIFNAVFSLMFHSIFLRTSSHLIKSFKAFGIIVSHIKYIQFTKEWWVCSPTFAGIRIGLMHTNK